jgi:hypothetical protein
MKVLSGCRPFRKLALFAALLSVMLTAGMVPVYSQQDVNPTWYDPWDATNTALVYSPTAQISVHFHPGTVVARPLRNSWKVQGTAHDEVNVALRAAQTRPEIRPLTGQSKNRALK